MAGEKSAEWREGYAAALAEIDPSGEHCATCADCGKSCREEAWEIGKDDAGDCCPHCGGKNANETRNNAAWGEWVKAPDDEEKCGKCGEAYEDASDAEKRACPSCGKKWCGYCRILYDDVETEEKCAECAGAKAPEGA